MKRVLMGRVLMAAALLASAGLAGAAGRETARAPQDDAGLAKAVQHELRMYPKFTIWDDVSFRVTDGQVDLQGEVSQPYKKQDMERIAANIPGVRGVTNDIRVLPLSPADDRLRLQVARAIYGDPALRQYSMMPLPPIHIIVENGHVTLDGVVNNELEKNVAGLRAAGAGLSFGQVVNNLTVEHSSTKRS